MHESSSRRWRAGLAAASLCAVASLAQAAPTVIGFEEFGNVGTSGPIITNQYPGVEFSSTDGNVNRVSSQANIGDGLNFLCTATSSINCTGETILTFAAGVSDLSFLAVGSNNVGVQAKVDVFVNNLFAATQDITVGGVFNTPDLVDLSSFSGVTSIRIYGITDGGGLGWDNFTFTAAVPEPGSYALMLAGLGVIGAVARRRRRD